MKGGESLGNEEGSEETSEEGSEEEVSPARIYTPGVRPLAPGVFLCPKNERCFDHRLEPADRTRGEAMLREAVRLRGTARGEAARGKGAILMQQPHVPR